MRTDLKPLYANLRRAGISTYIVTRDFKNLLIELDLDENWENCLSEHGIDPLSSPDDYEDAFSSLLDIIYQECLFNPDPNHKLNKVILGFFKWNKSPIDHKTIYDSLKKLDFLEKNTLKVFADQARKIYSSKVGPVPVIAADMSSPLKDLSKIFIIHGHDEISRLKLEKLLKEFKLHPVVLMDLPGESLGTIISKFEREASNCSVAVALFTPDDEMKNDSARPRQNVILELGYFMGRDQGNNRKIIVLKKAGAEGPSDIAGVETINFDKSIDEIAMKLQRQLQYWKVMK
jgi:predicted nucleotide-binding protein